MGCPPVRGDNPRALASGLSYVQVDKHGITISYHLHQCRPCTSRDTYVFGAEVGKGGIKISVHCKDSHLTFARAAHIELAATCKIYTNIVSQIFRSANN